LQCPRCAAPLRIIAFILEREVIVKILAHLGEPTDPPPLTPARGPPQGEFRFDQDPPVEFDQDAGQPLWRDLDQTAGLVEGP
jgi:hypothetical protein